TVMAASLGLNPEGVFSSAFAHSSPFLGDHYAPPARAFIDDSDYAAHLHLHDDHQHYPFDQFEYSPPMAQVSFAGAGDDEHRSEKTIKISARVSAGRIGFRTRSEVEILDDGFKWRKYGKKAVKNSPNPRNYYRCSAEGCGIKKRVERDRDDPRYVVTTYNGVHNHATPGAAAQYYCYSPPRSSPPAAYSAAGLLQF
uniref:WRKY domain-containing protein n=3 Tax=Aegilops tauschii TaxID=37682 RepID=A0A452Y5F1_AEGTS